MLILSSKDSNQQRRFRKRIGCNYKLGVVEIFSKLKLFAGFAYRSLYKLQ